MVVLLILSLAVAASYLAFSAGRSGMQFPLPLVGDVTALDMLDVIELYASACYDNTQRHLANIGALSTVEEILAYDYTLGYPEKLRF